MKKSIRINISGYIFNIDEDAYDELNQWLKAVSAQFKNDENAKEITADIEARVAEIFNERISESKQAVNISDISELIAVMGTPEDFSDGEFIETEEVVEEGNEDKNSFTSEEKNSFSSDERGNNNKKLFRDSDDRLLGGVCAGLGNYFGINPNIVRVLFAITILFWGTGILIYGLMWVLLDEAKTTADKLRMKGERINISNIEKSISSEFSAVKNSLSARSGKFNYDKLHDTFSYIGNSLWGAFQVALKVVLFLIGFGLFLYGVVAFLGLSGVFFFSDIIPGFISSEMNIVPIRTILDILPLGLSTVVTAISAYLVAIIPFIFIGIAGARVAFKFKRKLKYVGIAGITVWMAALIVTAFSGVGIAQSFSTTETYIEKVILSELNSDTLFLHINDVQPQSDYQQHNINFNGTLIRKINGETVLSGLPVFTIKQSKDSTTYVDTEYFASGVNRQVAQDYVRDVKYNWTSNDGVLTFDNYFSPGKSVKYHNQDTKVVLWLAVGKTVYLSEEMTDIIYDIKNVQNMWDPKMVGKFWTMTKQGLSITPNVVAGAELRIETELEELEEKLEKKLEELEK